MGYALRLRLAEREVEVVRPRIEVRAGFAGPGSGVEEELLAVRVQAAGDEVESFERELLGLSVSAWGRS